jgi:uncharacterized small protein (DUF1192 family)
VAAAGVRAGALGFDIAHHHTTLAGRHIPTLKADQAELAIAQALAKVGSGWLQVISVDEPEEEVALLRRLVERSRRPIKILQRDNS